MKKSQPAWLKILRAALSPATTVRILGTPVYRHTFTFRPLEEFMAELKKARREIGSTVFAVRRHK